VGLCQIGEEDGVVKEEFEKREQRDTSVKNFLITPKLGGEFLAQRDTEKSKTRGGKVYSPAQGRERGEIGKTVAVGLRILEGARG